MHIDVITIFPDYLAPLDLSLSGKAQGAGVLEVTVHDLRQWTRNRHRTVDDTPYGGGAGMVMRPEPWGEALDALVPLGGSSPPTMLVPTPTGRPLTQSLAEELAQVTRLLIACGRYEGIDARVVEHARSRMPVLEVSIGDYVVTGGEVAALVIIEAVVRLLPGFMGNPGSLDEESHGTGEGQGLLEYPTYTKPVTWRGLDVPAVLLSGHHAQVTRWRREQSLRRTARVRPDLLATYDVASLDPRDREVLAEEGWPGS
ncbi:MAG: tRNA (guanosine(37)-N1)-methyltransferase TrmD [Nocardioidaceae bacterium]|nr:tRNA (guanosine(37)-N1)-methyltransferase TrmD [Nocardioidaceae bacterium]